MTAARISRWLLSLAICCALCAPDADADSSSDADVDASNEVYESLDDIAIGKIFFSTKERTRLERRRGSTPTTGTVQSRGAQPIENNKNAAGYIIRNQGVASVYKGRDFVVMKNSSNSPVTFPGTVIIDRGIAKPGSETIDEDE